LVLVPLAALLCRSIEDVSDDSPRIGRRPVLPDKLDEARVRL
jgi:hypothetical protein